jgi:hypothetical protein
MRLAAILLPTLLPMLSPILGPGLSPLREAMLLPLPSPLLWWMLSPRLSSLPAPRLSSMLLWIPAPMRRRPQNRKSRRRGLRPLRAKRAAPTPDPDKSPCKQMHGSEIWFRCARARTIRSSASGIMMPMVDAGLFKSGGASGLGRLIRVQTSRAARTQSSVGVAQS